MVKYLPEREEKGAINGAPTYIRQINQRSKAGENNTEKQL